MVLMSMAKRVNRRSDQPVLPNIEIQIARWPIERLIPRANNPRTQVDSIAASMREWGCTNPILVGADDDIVAGYLPASISSTLKLTGNITVDPTSVCVFRIHPVTIEDFLSSPPSQAFAVYVRRRLADPGTSAYVIYETYRSSQIRMTADGSSTVGIEGGAKQIVKGAPYGEAKFQMAKDDKRLFVSGDRPYIFAVRTAKLLPGTGQILRLDASYTPIPGSLDADKYSVPVGPNFSAIELESAFPPVR